ncbi:MAG: FMN-binding protein [Oscillospiraceae bacterium]|jgi:uncharacterized protein with FMN-binding domain
MLISLILAWIAVILTIMTVLRYIARISRNKKLNTFFHKIHIPFGTLLIIVGGIHGILAGNPASATLANFEPASVLFTFNWGTVCYVLTLILALTYLLRKKMKRKWMIAHRIATVAMIVLLVLHIYDVGIRLPKRLFGNSQHAPAVTESSRVSSNSEQTNEQTSEQAKTTSSDTSANIVTFSGAQLKDGVYQGTADGYKGTITVSVTVKNGQVTAIDVISKSDTDRYFDEAKSLLDKIIGQQSLQVDAVTGATFSSAGLINAVYSALQNAVVSGTLQVNNIKLSEIH